MAGDFKRASLALTKADFLWEDGLVGGLFTPPRGDFSSEGLGTGFDTLALFEGVSFLSVSISICFLFEDNGMKSGLSSEEGYELLPTNQEEGEHNTFCLDFRFISTLTRASRFH